MRKLAFVFLIVAFLRADVAGTKPDWFSDIGQIESDLSSITGLSFKKPVPYAVIGRDELRRYLNERMKASLKPEDIRDEELVLKMMGLVPPDFDLRTATVDLLTEQAAAFYDYHQKKLFILENNNGPEARFALVHELAHALADQNFRLDKFTNEGAKSDDAATARLAVMEGQASWLMSAYMTQKGGGEPVVPEAVLQLLKHAFESTDEASPVLAKAPLYLRESLIFPYAEGLSFQDAVFHKFGREAFAHVFTTPPVSTHQILHPDAYLEGVGPVLPPAPHLDETKHLRKLTDGTLGEFDYRVLLTQFIGKERGEEQAAQLSGSVYQLYEGKHDHKPVLVLCSVWNSAESASKFFELYRQVLNNKWKNMNTSASSDHEIQGEGDTGHFRVMLADNIVTSVEGLR